jgi:hypothetical protein
MSLRYDEVQRLAQRLRTVPARRHELEAEGVNVETILSGASSAEDDRKIRLWFGGGVEALREERGE